MVTRVAGLPRHAYKRLRSSYFAVVILIVLFLLAAIEFILPYYEIEMSQVLLALIAIFAIFLVLLLDFIRDLRKQEQRIVEHTDRPPVFSERSGEIFEQLSSIHQEHLQHLLRLTAHKFAHYLKTEDGRVSIYLLCPRSGGRMGVLPEAYPEAPRQDQPLPVSEAEAGEAWRRNSIRVGMEPQADSGQTAFEAYIPLQSNTRRVIAVLCVKGSAPQNGDSIRNAILATLKYGFLIYHILVEIIKVEGEVE